MVDDSGWLHNLSSVECLRRLAAEEVGRLAIVVADRPAIYPVNYALDGDSIVIRTGFGTKLQHGRRSAASFEIDSLDRVHRTGWSVVVSGMLKEVTKDDDADLYQRLRRLDIQPWVSDAFDNWMVLVPSTIAGRQIGRE